jgi:hypothetical protein
LASGPPRSSIRKMASRADTSWWMNLPTDVGRPASEGTDFGAMVTDLSARCSLLATRRTAESPFGCPCRSVVSPFRMERSVQPKRIGSGQHSSRNRRIVVGDFPEFPAACPQRHGEMAQVTVRRRDPSDQGDRLGQVGSGGVACPPRLGTNLSSWGARVRPAPAISGPPLLFQFCSGTRYLSQQVFCPEVNSPLASPPVMLAPRLRGANVAVLCRSSGVGDRTSE